MNIRSGSVVELINADALNATKYHVGMRGVAYQVDDAWPQGTFHHPNYMMVFFVSDSAHRAKQLRAMDYVSAADFHIPAYIEGEQAFIEESCLKVVQAGKPIFRRGKRHRYKDRALKFEEA